MKLIGYLSFPLTFHSSIQRLSDNMTYKKSYYAVPSHLSTMVLPSIYILQLLCSFTPHGEPVRVKIFFLFSYLKFREENVNPGMTATEYTGKQLRIRILIHRIRIEPSVEKRLLRAAKKYFFAASLSGFLKSKL